MTRTHTIRMGLISITLFVLMSTILPCCSKPLQFRIDESNILFAYKYLQKYGYLNCINNEVSGDAAFAAPHSSPRNVDMRICDNLSFSEALRRLQLFLSLEITGDLDEATLSLMSMPRCGNVDAKTGVITGNRIDNGYTIKSHPADLEQLNNLPVIKKNLQATNSYAVEKLQSQNLNETSKKRKDRLSKRVNNILKMGSDNFLNVKRKLKSRRRERDKRSVNQKEVPSINDVIRSIKPFDQSIADSNELNKINYLDIDDQQNQLSYWLHRPHTSSLLHWNVITEGDIDVTYGRTRRSHMLEHIKEKMRNEMTNFEVPSLNGILRRKRSVDVQDTDDIKRFVWDIVVYKVDSKMSQLEQKSLVGLAFRIWSEVVPIRFINRDELEEDAELDAVYISISFLTGQHGDCDIVFESPNEVGHTRDANVIHLNAETSFTNGVEATPNQLPQVSLLSVLLHQIGHVLGLGHRASRDSNMAPLVEASLDGLELTAQDRLDVQRLHGVCSGRFDAVLDWISDSKIDSKSPDKASDYVYSTHFIRGNKIWTYDNKEDRTRLGDPNPLYSKWRLNVLNVDTVIQIITKKSDNESRFTIRNYIFSDDKYLTFEGDNAEQVEARPISSDFSCLGAHGNQSVPGWLDAAYFHQEDRMVYFFKNDEVFLFNPDHQKEDPSCRIQKYKLFEVFHLSDGNTFSRKVDAIYRSIFRNKIFIFSNNDVFELVPNGDSLVGASLNPLGLWNAHWRDICDP